LNLSASAEVRTAVKNLYAPILTSLRMSDIMSKNVTKNKPCNRQGKESVH